MNLDKNIINKLNIDSSTLIILYKRYKDYLLPVGVIIVSLLVLLFVVIPQVQLYFITREKLAVETAKLQIIQNNYNFLSNLDETQTDEELKVLTQTLPSGKDFAGVMNAISSVSSKTGVGVGDFSFQVGDLTDIPTTGVSSFPSFQLSINLSGSVNSIIKFIAELYKTSPLTEVISITSESNTTALTAAFYYKPYPPVNVSELQPIVQLSADSQNLIAKLETWGNSNTQELPPALSSSGSAAEPF